jgi:hypothetical protein
MAATNIPPKEVIINENTQISAESLGWFLWSKKSILQPKENYIRRALAYLIVPKLDLWKNSRIEKGVIVEQNLRALSD